MGWDFTKYTKKEDIMQDCIKSISADLLKKAVYGNEFWTLFKDNKGPFIVLFLLSKQDGCWGYKTMIEQDYPFYYKCPLSYLKLSEPKNYQWRSEVLKYHSAKS